MGESEDSVVKVKVKTGVKLSFEGKVGRRGEGREGGVFFQHQNNLLSRSVVFICIIVIINISVTVDDHSYSLLSSSNMIFWSVIHHLMIIILSYEDHHIITSS